MLRTLIVLLTPFALAAALRKSGSAVGLGPMPEPNFETVGPCPRTRTLRDALQVETATPSSTGSCTLKLTITAPSEPCSSLSGPYPVVVFLNGFQVSHVLQLLLGPAQLSALVNKQYLPPVKIVRVYWKQASYHILQEHGTVPESQVKTCISGCVRHTCADKSLKLCAGPVNTMGHNLTSSRILRNSHDLAICTGLFRLQRLWV